jgi:hypothetical protein
MANNRLRAKVLSCMMLNSTYAGFVDTSRYLGLCLGVAAVTAARLRVALLPLGGAHVVRDDTA